MLYGGTASWTLQANLWKSFSLPMLRNAVNWRVHLGASIQVEMCCKTKGIAPEVPAGDAGISRWHGMVRHSLVVAHADLVSLGCRNVALDLSPGGPDPRQQQYHRQQLSSRSGIYRGKWKGNERTLSFRRLFFVNVPLWSGSCQHPVHFFDISSGSCY